MSSSEVLRADKIVKKFGGVTALKNVSFDLRPGEIHSICGENGAGKSTLIKTLSGVYPTGSYEGKLYVDGDPVSFRNIKEAESRGIAVIYQELALVEEMTVAENIFLGREPLTEGFIDWDLVYRRSAELLERFNMDIDPSVKVKDLGVGKQQLVEIVKALGKESRVLILDEPTSALTDEEVRILLEILKELRSGHISCVYISHKLEEVFDISDRITVLRDGETITTLEARGTTRSEVIRHMVGREIEDLFPRRAVEKGAMLLRVNGLSVSPSPGEKPFLEDISFELSGGEVLGLGGLMGAGRTELLGHIFGCWGERVCGTIEIMGAKVENISPARSIDKGLVLVSEDRKRFGLVLDQSIGFNMSLSSLKDLLSGKLILDRDIEYKKEKELFEMLRIKAPGLETHVKDLSGGNQQKVVLGKALMTEPKIVFLDEPTRGIDVGAKVEVYELMNRLTASGFGIIMVSSELPELIGMSDRIIMLNEGRVGGHFMGHEADQENLIKAAIGHHYNERGTEGR